MRKPANLSIYINPETKWKAERILKEKGIPVTDAVNLFFESIVENEGLPSGIELPKSPVNRNKITRKQLNSEVEVLTQKIKRVWGS